MTTILRETSPSTRLGASAASDPPTRSTRSTVSTSALPRRRPFEPSRSAGDPSAGSRWVATPLPWRRWFSSRDLSPSARAGSVIAVRPTRGSCARRLPRACWPVCRHPRWARAPARHRRRGPPADQPHPPSQARRQPMRSLALHSRLRSPRLSPSRRRRRRHNPQPNQRRSRPPNRRRPRTRRPPRRRRPNRPRHPNRRRRRHARTGSTTTGTR